MLNLHTLKSAYVGNSDTVFTFRTGILVPEVYIDACESGFLYLIAGHRLMLKFGNHLGMSELSQPAVTCFSFSIELGLKSLLLKEGKPVLRSHELEDIFQQLSPRIRQKMTEHIDNHKISQVPPLDFIIANGTFQVKNADKEIKFTSVLRKISKYFKNSRYLHEGKGLFEFYEPYLEIVAEGVCEVCLDEFKSELGDFYKSIDFRLTELASIT